ncbi:chitinase 3 [Diaporthe amygdali]|uniref:chitinase 3 n=1 Tax=Phomopsis amygdali TaxID=1214568 RepID=UPI0022FF2BF1|nr:chitinase 3 [Diaporthe amygdali]KAJ0120792.1 chitinase 3 [Diaporthe amygdali]
MRLSDFFNAAALLASFGSSLPVQDASSVAVNPELPRLVIYFQTTHDSSGDPISMLPLITELDIALTHLIVCSFHINLGSEIHLNDYPPYYPLFSTLWNETVVMREAGVKVMGMIGGAAPGSFDSSTLDSTDEATFELYYGQLHDVIVQYGLQGMDLDVEQYMSQAGITRLVTRLHADFGDEFIITLAPVASALTNQGNLSGFDYKDLEAASVTASGQDMIDFYNAQFYSGFGTMSSPLWYERVVKAGWDPKDIVAGQLTSPVNGGGFTSIADLNQTVIALKEEYGVIGGIMGWEYFNSVPGGTAAPWQWAQEMTEILRPGYNVQLTVTDETAQTLDTAWKESVIDAESNFVEPRPNVDYFAMVNA